MRSKETQITEREAVVTVQRIETQFAGRPLTLETGRMAKQAAGSAVLRFGDTMVLAAVTVSPNISTLPFFPLTVEYREKTYAAGKIPGGFLKREGRPSDKEILASRLIDRSIRPLFPEGFKNEVQVFVTVLSADQENDADILGVVAASAALSALARAVERSARRRAGGPGRGQLDPEPDVPAARVLHHRPRRQRLGRLDRHGRGRRARRSPKRRCSRRSRWRRRASGTSSDCEKQLVDKAGAAQKMEWTKAPRSISAAWPGSGSWPRRRWRRPSTPRTRRPAPAAVKAVQEQALAEAARAVPGARPGRSRTELEDIEYRVMRQQVLEQGERVDGRDLDTIRPITIETGVLPRTHGSALFTRGQTQALVSVTLGTADDEQRIDSIDVAGETTKSFMLHYNFPPFSTGEVKMIRGTSRREIGHGALAERALQPLLPHFEDFPTRSASSPRSSSRTARRRWRRSAAARWR